MWGLFLLNILVAALVWICTCFQFILMSIYLYVVQVDGMDVLAVKQACKFAKEHALKNGPIVSNFFFSAIYTRNSLLKLIISQQLIY